MADKNDKALLDLKNDLALADFNEFAIKTLPGLRIVSNSQGISRPYNHAYDFFVNPVLGEILSGINLSNNISLDNNDSHSVSLLGLYNNNCQNISGSSFNLIDGYFVNTEETPKVFSRLATLETSLIGKELPIRRADLTDLFSPSRAVALANGWVRPGRFLFETTSAGAHPIKGVLLDRVSDARVINYLTKYKLL